MCLASGTSLDTARMRRTVADLCNIAPQSVIGFAMGEHGDSSMVPFSNLTIFGKNYKHLKEENPERFGKLSEKSYNRPNSHERYGYYKKKKVQQNLV
ncbi:MAG: hypothetical protein ACLUR5_11715 [Eubacterium ventriosum]